MLLKKNETFLEPQICFKILKLRFIFHLPPTYYLC